MVRESTNSDAIEKLLQQLMEITKSGLEKSVLDRMTYDFDYRLAVFRAMTALCKEKPDIITEILRQANHYSLEQIFRAT